MIGSWQQRISAVALAGAIMAAGIVPALSPEREVTRQEEKLKEQAAKNSHIDLTLCLDTSNSMDDLIDSAKLQPWSIVNTLATADPEPKLRVALYSYGNDGYNPENGWVRKELDFTNDLDAVYAALFDLQTNGGTEYVARVTRAAMMQDWTAPEEEHSLRLLFVAGNEPADQDGRFSLEEVTAQAAERGVIVNTLYCGGAEHGDSSSWRSAARLGKGEFAAIDPSRRVVYATPFDDELAKLSGELNKTYIGYGSRELVSARATTQSAQDNNAAQMGAAVAAQRAQAKSSSLYNNEDWDLVDAYHSGKAAKVITQSELLSEEMVEMSEEERLAYVKEQAEKRKEIQMKIQALSEKRGAHIEEQKKDAAENEGGFETALKTALVKQAATHGIIIPE